MGTLLGNISVANGTRRCGRFRVAAPSQAVREDHACDSSVSLRCTTHLAKRVERGEFAVRRGGVRDTGHCSGPKDDAQGLGDITVPEPWQLRAPHWFQPRVRHDLLIHAELVETGHAATLLPD